MRICCFTGHRTLPPQASVALCRALDKRILSLFEAGVTEFRAGGARGFDTLAALRVLSLREKHPEVRLVLYLPCRSQSDGWREGERALYDQILSEADEVHYVCEQYVKGCMQLRNRALVTGSDVCVAYLTRGEGGTRQTVLFAMQSGLTVVNLAEEL